MFLSDQMSPDITVPCGQGIINIRVGAVIIKGDKMLMVSSKITDAYYTVGGRIKFGETAEEAIVREVEEETGVHLDIDHLAFVHENYFMGDIDETKGHLIYELAFYFVMKVPTDFTPVSQTFYEEDNKECLLWVPFDTTHKVYPKFFSEKLLLHADTSVKHFVTDDRPKGEI